MNIFAIYGHKVIVTEESKTNGYDHDKNAVKEHLEVGKEYTVKKTRVHGWSTDVELEEFPGKHFNSVNFEDVEEQSPSKDAMHTDWERYN